jgi:hypothetical protein
MKAELDVPAIVTLTGRHERLRPQIPWPERWKYIRYVLLALIPVVAVGILWLIYRHPWR